MYLATKASCKPTQPLALRLHFMVERNQYFCLRSSKRRKEVVLFVKFSVFRTFWGVLLLFPGSCSVRLLHSRLTPKSTIGG